MVEDYLKILNDENWLGISTNLRFTNKEKLTEDVAEVIFFKLGTYAHLKHWEIMAIKNQLHYMLIEPLSVTGRTVALKIKNLTMTFLTSIRMAKPVFTAMAFF